MDKVTIIVTAYLAKSKRYLDLCMKSIENLDYPKDKLEVFIISHQSFQPQYDNAKTMFPHYGNFYPAEAINYGMNKASKDSKYFFILNDDVIVTRNALKHLVEAVGGQKLMANSISPCDNGQIYNLAFGYPKEGSFKQVIGHQFKYEEFEPDANEMMNAEALYSRGYVCMPFLCIYATLIPRAIYEAIGAWDENFKCGQDDLDYSWRAQASGFQTVAILDSLVWHFSGVTAETTVNMDIRRENVRYFKKKWGKMPPGIPESFIAD